MDNFFINYCILVQVMTLIYFYAIIPPFWFFKKGKLITTHEFLSTFWPK